MRLRFTEIGGLNENGIVSHTYVASQGGRRVYNSTRGLVVKAEQISVGDVELENFSVVGKIDRRRNRIDSSPAQIV